MTDNKIATRYAKALILIANEQKLTDTVYQDINFIFNTLEESNDLFLLTKNPIVKPEKKSKIFTELFKEKVNQLTFSFLALLIKKGREKVLRSICLKYFDLYNEQNNKIEVEISTAKDAKEEIKKLIETKISNWTGKEVIAKYKVKPDLIGGFQARFADYVYDASIRQKLQSLKDELTTLN